MNQLWFGDNLTILREEIKSESVDLVYLDPPFNSNANYNVLFKTPADEAAGAQVEAFRDTWTWGNEAQWALDEIMRSGSSVAAIIRALHTALGESDMMAYLVMMSQRLGEIRRVMKSSASLYLHCDSTASHYLKILLDSIFKPNAFTNEIIWQRTSPKGLSFTRFPSTHDNILFYRKGGAFSWNSQYLPYSDEYELRFNLVDEATGKRFQATSLINPNPDRPNLRYEFHGHTKTWRWTRDRMLQAERDGIIYFPPSGGVPREKRFLEQQEGIPVTTVWTDIPALNARAQERVGYPTQKPRALLERIIAASSKENDVILDPFCGCGTTIAAAEHLHRSWIGIDVAFHAIRVIEDRIKKQNPSIQYGVGGIPRDFEAAQRLAQNDKFQFQWWANYLVGVQALKEIKKGPDRGIDGQMYFMNGPRGWGKILTSVKGGQHVGAKDVREFKAVIGRDEAEMGLFICLNPPTREMASEAASFGFVETAHGHLPRLQIVSIADWFRGKKPVLPSLGHVSRDFFEPEKSAKPKKGKRPDPNAPEFKFSFPGQKQDGAVVYLNPTALSEQKSA